jgi:hypothetical protein
VRRRRARRGLRVGEFSVACVKSDVCANSVCRNHQAVAAEDESEEGRQAWFRNMWESDPQPHGIEQQQRDAHETIDIEQPIQQDEEDDFGDDFDDFAEGGENDDADFGDFDEADDTPSQPPQPLPQQHKPPPAPDILAGLVSSSRNATYVPLSNLSFQHQAYDHTAASRLLIPTRFRRHPGSNSSLYPSHIAQLNARGSGYQHSISTRPSIISVRSVSLPLATTCLSATNATTKLDTLPHSSTLPRQLGSPS